MNKQHTLIDSSVSRDEHAYEVTIGTDMGQFTGSVYCQMQDWDYESRYFGLELAEIKAEIEYARAKRRYYDAQLKALTEFWRNMAQTRTYDIDAFWVKKMRNKVDDIEVIKEFWTNRIKTLKEIYHTKILDFDAAVAARKRKGI